jgi:photosystem II biogenesis protein Psp29
MKTVSDSKRAFYAAYPRPINSVYRRVIEELLVEMHLLSVNADFKSDPIYYLGIVTSFERLMQGYDPEGDQDKIFNALCTSTDANPQTYKSEAETLLSLAKDKSTSDLVAWLKNPEAGSEANSIIDPIKAIATNHNFKYSRPFAIGIYTLLEASDRELVKEQEKRDAILDTISENFGFVGEKMKKDLELYRANLEKMTQLLKVIEDVLEASRKQRAKREQEQSGISTEKKEVEEAAAE